ncbi:MAG: ATP-dependent DNA helicase [Chitinivibrionales bacterium]|nr:ATP-dependent DNA helicase [Chitinivibrionales bacterium]MBD3356113.1 ATP-dependent DNA helicase [Chitinivibrionales bacterium]
MKPEILRIPVLDLVHTTCRCGDLDSSTFGGVDPAEAVRIHQRIYKKRPREYTAEVCVSRSVECGGFVCDIGGRIDGVYEYPDRLIVDEIKTTKKELGRFIEREQKMHWAQAKCYAAMYLYQEDIHDEYITLQLTYFQVEIKKQEELCRSFHRSEIESFFLECVRRYADWMDRIRQWERKRNESCQKLTFPYAEFRPGQYAMAGDVFRTIRDCGRMLLQAPTGIGKSMASLFPALKAMGEGYTGKIFYLTARTTGKASAEKALHHLREHGASIKAVTLTAKQKICLNEEFLCTAAFCPYAHGHFDRIQTAVEEGFTKSALTAEMIQRIAREHTVCPFELSLDMALWVDCIIGDYNYVFDPRVRLGRFFDCEDANYTLLVDEAHNLVDRSREMFSARISSEQVRHVRSMIKEKIPKLHRALGGVQRILRKKHKVCTAAEGAGIMVEVGLDEELVEALKRCCFAAEAWLARNIQTEWRSAVLGLYFDVLFFGTIAELYDEHYVSVYEMAGGRTGAKLFCLDPSANMRNALRRGAGVVFFSATLRPFDYFARLFGCREEVQTLEIPSPFPTDKCCVVIQAAVSTRYAERAGSIDSVVDTISRCAGARRGNYLCFFPSYEYMHSVYERFLRLNPSVDVVMQRRGLSEEERTEFIEGFADTAITRSALMGFVLMGGVFGEGIDLVGDRLTGAIVVGVGLPGMSVEREEIKSYFGASNGDGFGYAYRYPGMTRVVQAAGRVIRSEKDTGVIVLVDQRYQYAGYRKLLPLHWGKHACVVHDNRALERRLAAFWEKHRG